MYNMASKLHVAKLAKNMLLAQQWNKSSSAVRLLCSLSSPNGATCSAKMLAPAAVPYKRSLGLTQSFVRSCSKMPEAPAKKETRIAVYESDDAIETNKEQEQLPVKEDASNAFDDLTEEQLQEHVQELKSQIERVRKEHNTLESSYENVVKSMQAECLQLTRKIVTTRSFTIQNMAQDLLVVAEQLRSALDAVPRFLVNDTRPDLEFVYNRVARINDDLLMTFKRNGVHKMHPIGEQFDPQYHEVVYRKPTKDAIPNAIVEVVEPGFRLWERCLKPAKVGVAAYVKGGNVNLDDKEDKKEKV